MMKVEMTWSLSVCLAWIPKRSFSVCLAKITIWRMKCNVVCSCVMLGFQYEGWKEKEFVCKPYLDLDMRSGMIHSLSVCLSLSLTWRVKRNAGCPTVCLTCIPIWGLKKVRPSVFYPNMRGEMKRRLSVCLSKTTIWGVKWKLVCPSVSLE